MNGQLHALAVLPPRERDLLSISREAVWDPGLVWTVGEVLVPHLHLIGGSPASSVLLYGLSSAGPLLMCSFGSNEPTSHSPKRLYLLYRLGVLIGYSACESAVVSRCLSCILFDGRDCSGGTPLRRDSFVKELGTPILPCPYTRIRLRGFHVTSG